MTYIFSGEGTANHILGYGRHGHATGNEAHREETERDVDLRNKKSQKSREIDGKGRENS